MKEIQLTQGKVSLVDDEDYEWLNQWKWCAIKKGNTFYAVRNQKTDEMVGNKRNLVMMHREILTAKDGMDVDHIDRNGLNNQKKNIRQCSHEMNMRNQTIKSTNTSGYKGVSWSKDNRKWIAQIVINGTNRYIGSFNSKQDAARAYDSVAFSYYGEFAKLNFPISF